MADERPTCALWSSRLQQCQLCLAEHLSEIVKRLDAIVAKPTAQTYIMDIKGDEAPDLRLLGGGDDEE